MTSQDLDYDYFDPRGKNKKKNKPQVNKDPVPKNDPTITYQWMFHGTNVTNEFSVITGELFHLGIQGKISKINKKKTKKNDKIL